MIHFVHQQITHGLKYFTVFMFSITLPLVANAESCGSDGFCNPLKFGTIQEFIEGFLQSIVYIGFPVAVLFVVYSGFLFVFAQGNSSELEKAKKNFLWTVIGVGLFLGAWALAMLIRGTIDQLR